MSPRDRGRPQRIDWLALRETLDLADVAARLLGPAPGRRGERSGRLLWWHCPFHEDANPSFCVKLGSKGWKCFGCGEHGDAASLVMRVNGLSFPEAVRFLTGEAIPARASRPRPEPRNVPPRPEKPHAMSLAEAEALVAEAECCLWSAEGAEGLAYLRGPRRHLTDATIRAARLGVIVTDRHGAPVGIVVPWFVARTLTLVKIRRPEGVMPKYHEAFRDRSQHLGLYPGPGVIRAGRPLIITEGEFDPLLLGQELAELFAVATLGSASARPSARILGPMLTAAPWYIATDADPAGDRSATDWPASSRRVRPPAPLKDWTEAKAGGVDLHRWWSAILAGVRRPPLVPWEELSSWRWGPAERDSLAGLIVDRLDMERMLEALSTTAHDSDAKAERLAIQLEGSAES